MRLSFYLGALAPLLLAVASEQLVIPEYEALVQSIISSASSKIDDTRPTGSTSSAAAESTAVAPKVNAAAATTYWYEQITHQGISAFGPSGYTVYRNVKDYGAKGTITCSSC